jgi:hypothetical protein
MPRIIVTTDPLDERESPVLFNETVDSLHLRDDHAANQLIERLAWAVDDAETRQRAIAATAAAAAH